MAERKKDQVPAVAVDIDDIMRNMNHNLQAIDAEPTKKDSCIIYRVLPSIRDEGQGAFDPKVISIGPLHRGKDALHPMEQLKWRFLHDLIGRDPSNSLASYVHKVRSLAARARKSYSELPKLQDDAFVEMLVLDCCFIIEFLVKIFIGDDPNGPLYAVNWNLPLLRNDLLLVENQVPYFVLQSLFDSSVIPELNAIVKDGNFPITLTDLAINYVTSGEYDAAPNSNDVHHLLHLFHSNLRPSTIKIETEAYPCVRSMKKVKQILLGSLFWLLSLLLYCRQPPPAGESSRAPRSIPSATELREAGIQFKKKEARRFMDITFRDGTIEMPLLSIQAGTIALFRNLMAFEQSCPSAGSYFTAYVALMDNLIDTPKDVGLLEDCNILESKLGGKEEVSSFFNSLGKGGYLDYEKRHFAGLFKELKDYSAVKTNRWRAMLVRDYFSNPWSIASLIAATVLLVLTAIQTVFTVVQYFHPPQDPSVFSPQGASVFSPPGPVFSPPGPPVFSPQGPVISPPGPQVFSPPGLPLVSPQGPVISPSGPPVFSPQGPVISPPGPPVFSTPGAPVFSPKGPVISPSGPPVFSPPGPVFSPPGAPVFSPQGPVISPSGPPVFSPPGAPVSSPALSPS